MCKKCSIPGCENKHIAKGFCHKHYKQYQKEQKILNNIICSVPNCTNPELRNGYCEKHLYHLKKYGKILDRTMFDENEIIEYDDYAEIILYDKDCKEIARTLIDLEDIEKIKGYKCCYHQGYVQIYDKETKMKIRLHRFIMDCPEDMVVDHINHNTLDNRKENLRICLHQENMHNLSTQKNNSSGVTGVYRNGKNWAATIYVNGKRKYLGTFKTIDEAKQVREQAEIDYYGDFAPKK